MSTGRPRRTLVAATPTNFGVQRVLPPNAWKPDALAVLDAVAELGYDGVSLGPPGYLAGDGVLRNRLASRGLRLAEAFLPLHFSREERFPDERTSLRETLGLLADATDESERPLAVLSEGFQEPARWSVAGRAGTQPQTWLPPERLPVLVSNLHRAAEDCRNAGFTPVFHHHAGTFVETDAEIRAVFEAVDPALVGMCLDTAHALLGQADPVRLAEDYHHLIGDVHVKDVSLEVVAASNEKKQNLTELTIEGAFTRLGAGHVALDDVFDVLDRHDYRGWIVIEQDRLLTTDDRFEDVVDDQRHNLAYVQRLVAKWQAEDERPVPA